MGDVARDLCVPQLLELQRMNAQVVLPLPLRHSKRVQEIADIMPQMLRRRHVSLHTSTL
jgi:hypothetical protein